jgi:hypothetical protein
MLTPLRDSQSRGTTMFAYLVWLFINPKRYDMLMVIVDSHQLHICFSLYSALADWHDNLGPYTCTSHWWAFQNDFSKVDAYIREALVYVIPIGMIQAITNRQIGLKWAVLAIKLNKLATEPLKSNSVITELIAGFMIPGRYSDLCLYLEEYDTGVRKTKCLDDVRCPFSLYYDQIITPSSSL